MRERLRGLVMELWDGDDPRPATRLLGLALAPGEIAFRSAIAARSRWFDRTPATVPSIPVVSVGNLTVGGTGKTPVLRWLGDWFRRRGIRTAVVVRGYGRDEVALYRRWFGGDAVFAGVDRHAGVRAAGKGGFQLALLDDGFQRRRLARTLDILLVAAEDPWRIRMLPRGRYREPLGAAGRATHVLLTRRTASRRTAEAWNDRLVRVSPGAPVLNVEMTMGEWLDLDGGPVQPPCGDVLAVCAIGRPRAFATGLGRLLPEARIELAPYPDHHEYTAGDVAALLSRRAGRAIVCTEKDAVKLARHRDLARHAVSVGFRVGGEPRGPLLAALTSMADRL
ncbi:MAG: tetraacyldisaccharide 4'-kinase [Gemmatimonadetes bacterium]|nr:tetraacyldisaccharide 4'-kinase [Gemmatimonadota bacterium]MYK66565.1 tetraacyldisaccharide 4'-kinase [Gemmatimonadota bacterium]